MSAALPPWAAAVTALLVVAGSLLALVGSIGLLRMKTFYERVHPPTMGTTLGIGLVLVASMVYFTVTQSRPVLHEILVGVFMTMNTPVTYVLLVRAAVHRDALAGVGPAAREPAPPEQAPPEP
ncbi:MAG: monovalent cation/H(+) antiporter subunit G [Burkholderiales bacterium]|nr:monovalent cation/H(+) antiporter subunit G [Burkholderiales bacterium]MCL4687347.1 monovalent cation/H(+) antiporter subunit G [Burkholderiales bacterium]